ncbi:MAG TPA: hypothetical protein VEP90_12460 [Methylomirabilota bacterium]|nr:hypothetical protein [Methylomirabilota bacterium]
MPKANKKQTNLPQDCIITTYSDKPPKKKTPLVGKYTLDGIEKKTVPLFDLPKGGRTY